MIFRKATSRSIATEMTSPQVGYSVPDHRRRPAGQFCSGGADRLSHSCPKIFRHPSVRKTADLTRKITFSHSPHPLLISKNPGFRALHLAGRNFLINAKNHFLCRLLSENLALISYDRRWETYQLCSNQDVSTGSGAHMAGEGRMRSAVAIPYRAVQCFSVFRLLSYEV